MSELGGGMFKDKMWLNPEMQISETLVFPIAT